MRPFLWPNEQMLGRAQPPNDINSGDTSNSPPVTPDSLIPPQASQRGTQKIIDPVPTLDLSKYGDGQLQSVTFTGAGSLLVSARPPSGRRVLLIVQNTIAGFTIRINLDTPASAVFGIELLTDGVLFQDAVVFQNDIHVFAPAAGIVQVCTMNVDPGLPWFNEKAQ